MIHSICVLFIHTIHPQSYTIVTYVVQYFMELCQTQKHKRKYVSNRMQCSKYISIEFYKQQLQEQRKTHVRVRVLDQAVFSSVHFFHFIRFTIRQVQVLSNLKYLCRIFVLYLYLGIPINLQLTTPIYDTYLFSVTFFYGHQISSFVCLRFGIIKKQASLHYPLCM